jgi:uncharacterized protein (UPF0254 family)
MQGYVKGKGGMKTSDVVITVAVVAIIIKCGGDINIHASNQVGRGAYELLMCLKEAIMKRDELAKLKNEDLTDEEFKERLKEIFKNAINRKREQKDARDCVPQPQI